MSTYTGSINELYAIGVANSGRTNENNFCSNYQYTNGRYRSGTQSIRIYPGGTFEFFCGISSLGSKTIEGYIWSGVVGAGKIEVYDPDSVLIGSDITTDTLTWERVFVSFTASQLGNYRVRIKNILLPPFSNSCKIFIDDVSLL